MWTLMQVGIIKIQKNKPRFLLPKSLRPLVIKDYYRYERSFESVADNESAQGMFSSLDSDDQFSKVQKLKDKECAICFTNIGLRDEKIESKTFMRTPCNHAFHVTCLADWMGRGKATCPCCRR